MKGATTLPSVAATNVIPKAIFLQRNINRDIHFDTVATTIAIPKRYLWGEKSVDIKHFNTIAVK